MDAPHHSGPTMSRPASPYLSHGEAGRGARDPEAWGPESVAVTGDPSASELARRLAEADLEVLRPAELIQFSLTAGRLAAWADGLRRAAETQLVVLLGGR